MKIIEVIVYARGETTIQTKGFSGSECQQATKALEAALGAKLSDQPTSEFYTTSAQQAEIKA
jgi:hypothetical protein